jgi:replication factor A1
LFLVEVDIICLFLNLCWVIFLCDCRYDSEGKGASLASICSDMVSPGTKSGARSMYSDRVFLSHITSDPTLGYDKVHHYSEIWIYFSKVERLETLN